MNEAKDQNEYDINSLDGHQFEDLIEALVRKMGFTVEERKLTADGGIDLLAHSHEPLFEGKYIIQCKRYAQKVPEPPLRDLYGVVHSRNANKGILITNSSFTQAAINFAKDKQLELIDGTKLLSLLHKYNLLKFSGGARLAENATYLLYNFLPAMKKLKRAYEDTKSVTKTFSDRARASEKEWHALIRKTMDSTRDFSKWWGKTWTADFVPLLNEKPLNMEKIKETNGYLIQSVRSYIKIYATFVETVPPTKFSEPHGKFLRLFDAFFDSLFTIVNELETLAELPTGQLEARIGKKGAIEIAYRIEFSEELYRDAIEAYGRAASSEPHFFNAFFRDKT